MDRFIRKRYVEECEGIDMMYYLHFVGENAVRQLEISENDINMVTDESPLEITDADLSELDLLPEDFITADEFNRVWISPEAEQQRLFGKNA